MISHRTTLVLGAGASAHLGYPLGRALVAQLCARDKHGFSARRGVAEDEARVEAFLERLSRSDPASIDAHLEANPDDIILGKQLITQQLKRYEDLERLFPPNDTGWYREVFDALVVKKEPRFDDGMLSVVTFNYDRSLEAYMYTRLKAQFRIDDELATKMLGALPIVHVHGMLGAYPEVPYSTEADQSQMRRIAEGIQIIHEIADREDDFCSAAFRRANELLARSDRIYFLGFGWHRDNIRRFRFFGPGVANERVIRSTMTGMGPVHVKQLQTSLEEFGLPSNMLVEAQCNQFFSYVAGL